MSAVDATPPAAATVILRADGSCIHTACSLAFIAFPALSSRPGRDGRLELAPRSIRGELVAKRTDADPEQPRRPGAVVTGPGEGLEGQAALRLAHGGGRGAGGAPGD